MRIALFISGRIENNIEYFLEKIKKYELNNPNIIIDIFLSINDTQNNEQIELLNPAAYNFEKINFPEYLNNSPIEQRDGNIFNMYSMYYNNYKCFELIKKYMNNNNFVYDIIIKYRIDILCNNFLDLSYFNENSLFIPENNDWNGLNDQVAYGSYNIMEKYCNLYLFYEKYINEKVLIHPETFLKHHISVSNLNLNLKRFNWKYSLKR